MERRVGQLLLAGVLLSAGCLVVGLAMWLFQVGAAESWLNTGILVLMVTPLLRVGLAVAEYAHQRDWFFFGVAAAVLTIVLLTVFYSAAVR